MTGRWVSPLLLNNMRPEQRDSSGTLRSLSRREGSESSSQSSDHSPLSATTRADHLQPSGNIFKRYQIVETVPQLLISIDFIWHMCSFMKLYMIIAELLMILITLAHTTAQSQLQMFILGFDSSLT